MNERILALAALYGIKANDNEGCRIIENGVARPANSKDMEVILGISLEDINTETYSNWITENPNINFSIERDNWYPDSDHLTDFKEIPEELKGAA